MFAKEQSQLVFLKAASLGRFCVIIINDLRKSSLFEISTIADNSELLSADENTQDLVEKKES